MPLYESCGVLGFGRTPATDATLNTWCTTADTSMVHGVTKGLMEAETRVKALEEQLAASETARSNDAMEVARLTHELNEVTFVANTAVIALNKDNLNEELCPNLGDALCDAYPYCARNDDGNCVAKDISFVEQEPFLTRASEITDVCRMPEDACRKTRRCIWTNEGGREWCRLPPTTPPPDASELTGEWWKDL